MKRVKLEGALGVSCNTLLRIIVCLVAIITIVGLGVAILTAYFGVPMGDDYLAIKTYSNKHTWLAESWHSLTNTSRYMQSITSSVAYGLLRERAGVVLPLIVMAWMYTLIVLYIRLASKRLGLSISNLGACTIAAPILFMFMSSGRSDSVNHLWFTYQAFYFSSAIVTYTLAVLLYLSLLYFILVSKWFHRKSVVIQAVLVAAAAYLLGLYNETTPATILGISLISVVLVQLTPIVKGKLKIRLSLLLSSVALASVASLLSMYFSPANIARRQTITSLGVDRSNLVESVLTNFMTATSSLMLRPSDIALALLIGVISYTLIIGRQSQATINPLRWTSTGIITIALGLLVLLGTLVLLGIGYGASPNIYPRMLLIPQLLLGSGLIVLSIGLASKLYSYRNAKVLHVAVLGILAMGALAITPHHISRSAEHLASVQDYYAIWQAQDYELQIQSKTNPNERVYIQDEGAGIGDGFSTRCTGPSAKYTLWLTDGMESYYGLREICAQSDLRRKADE